MYLLIHEIVWSVLILAALWVYGAWGAVLAVVFNVLEAVIWHLWRRSGGRKGKSPEEES